MLGSSLYVYILLLQPAKAAIMQMILTPLRVHTHVDQWMTRTLNQISLTNIFFR